MKSDETINEEDFKDDSSMQEAKDQEENEDNAQTTKKDELDTGGNKRKVSIQVPVSYEIKDDDSIVNKEHKNQTHAKEDEDRWNEKEQPKHQTYHDLSHRKSLERSSLSVSSVRKRECRSTSPQRRRSTLQDLGLITGGQQPCNHKETSHQQLLRIQPAIPANANIRNILENVSRSGKCFRMNDMLLNNFRSMIFF